MISYPEYKGKLIKMVEEYPIYDSEDDHVVIGHTEIGDMAVVTYANKDEDYYEMMIVSGKYIGVDTLALNGKDLEKSIFVFNQIDYCGSIATKENRSMSNLLCTLVDNYVQLNKQQERLTAYYNLISNMNKSDTE